MQIATYPKSLAIPLERDLFLRTLIRELAGTLEEVVGIDEASGYISLVGQNVGEWINRTYTTALGVETLSAALVAEVLVDLKARIKGDFSILTQDEDQIQLINRCCPFADKVVGRPSMCMMTSNIFGVIAAENLGYAKVALRETIANGGEGCLVTVYLKPTPEAMAAHGREYFRTGGGCAA